LSVTQSEALEVSHLKHPAVYFAQPVIQAQVETEDVHLYSGPVFPAVVHALQVKSYLATFLYKHTVHSSLSCLY